MQRIETRVPGGTMSNYISCSWCHEMVDIATRYCPRCGHRAHLPRMQCGCPQCRSIREQAARMTSEILDALVAAGAGPDDARIQAERIINSQGILKAATGECPVGSLSPMACMFCPYGHMTNCHYPLTCEEAECIHYQAEMEAEGYFYREPQSNA